MPQRADWPAYLEHFHTEHAGITERILSRCRADVLDPYEWCAQPLSDRAGPTLDLACGSGPMADHVDGWIGADRSAAELATAQVRGRLPVIRASATSAPIREASLEAVVCSMGLQIIEPIPSALTEIARVLRPLGRVVLLLPASGPLRWRQALTYWRLQIALRQRITYPNDDLLRATALRQAAAAARLKVAHDELLAFSLALDTDSQADELLASLYLPNVRPRGLAAGRRVLHERVGGQLTVPLRRIVLDKVDRPGALPAGAPGGAA